jgi:hypothetical protein
MSYEYHSTTDLVALPNRTVQTYPSGLVRIERSFVCKKSQVAKYRNTLKVNQPMPFDNGAPAIDGIYIFPEPQEVVRDDGFVEFRVTAYGRSNIFLQTNIERSSIKTTYPETIVRYIDGVSSVFNYNVASINDVYTVRGVLPSSASPEIILTAPTIENPLVIDLRTNTPLVPGTIYYSNSVTTIDGLILYRQKTTSISLYLDTYTSTNFGQFSEYIVIWKTFASVEYNYSF